MFPPIFLNDVGLLAAMYGGNIQARLLSPNPKRHNALSNVMENEEYAVPMAYVFCQENIQIKGRVIYYPIYMITFFEQIQAEEKVYKFDLTGL